MTVSLGEGRLPGIGQCVRVGQTVIDLRHGLCPCDPNRVSCSGVGFYSTSSDDKFVLQISGSILSIAARHPSGISATLPLPW
jgi:hypothetical protein